MKKTLGKFGEFVREYERARRQYPREVLNMLRDITPVDSPRILDLGCGTGISTRQLAKYGKVTGCDPDRLMLKAAKKHKKINHEKYILASAKKIPFNDSTFDIVTAFSAFHWFVDKRSIYEIKRVLKTGGIFFVVNKTGVKSWGEGYRRTIIKTIGQDIASFKEDHYNPRRILQAHGFKHIGQKIWKKKELFTSTSAIEYVQAVSIWNSVPRSYRQDALYGLKKYFQKLKEEKGKIERKLTVKAVVGTK